MFSGRPGQANNKFCLKNSFHACYDLSVVIGLGDGNAQGSDNNEMLSDHCRGSVRLHRQGSDHSAHDGGPDAVHTYWCDDAVHLGTCGHLDEEETGAQKKEDEGCRIAPNKQ